MTNDDDKCPACDGWTCGNDCLAYWRDVESGYLNKLKKLSADLGSMWVELADTRAERDEASDEVELAEKQIEEERRKAKDAQLAERRAFQAAAQLDELCTEARRERDEAVDRAEKMHLLGLKLAREIADLERENASLRRRLREGGR